MVISGFHIHTQKHIHMHTSYVYTRKAFKTDMEKDVKETRTHVEIFWEAYFNQND